MKLGIFSSGLAACAAVASLALTVPAAHAQPAAAAAGAGGGIDIDYDAIAKAKSGAWSDYAVSMPNAEKAPLVRYSLVDKAGQKLAIEVDTPTKKGDILMHFDFGAVGADGWKMTGGKMKLGDQPPMTMPAAAFAQAAVIKKGSAPGDLVGTEDVTTPAGKFTCRHYTKKFVPPAESNARTAPITVDLWMSDKVLPTGLVKSSIGPMLLTLAATGNGASAKLP
jgi:hypothetical protein